jgi:NADPH:quinone reductase-like Zn-dependent oxidoreductase
MPAPGSIGVSYDPVPRMMATRIHSFDGPAGLRYEELDVADPGQGEVRVRVHACGVNRMDSELVKGEYGGIKLEDFYFGEGDLLPHTPGIEPAGEVDAVGADVTGWARGDRVLVHSQFTCGHCEWCRRALDNHCPEIRVLGVQTPGLGGWTEALVVPAANLIRLPDTISDEEAATIEVNIGTSWWMVNYRAKVRPQDVVLIPGAAGGVGTASVQIAKLCGATVIAAGGDDERLRKTVELGADHTVNYRRDKLSEAVLELTGGRGASVVVDTVGKGLWDEMMASLAIGGRLINCGAHTGLIVDLNLGYLFGKNLDIMGTTRAPRWAMEEAVQLVADGKIKAIVSDRYPLERAGEAVTELENREHFGKIVLTM